ncbi:tyrosine-type recombinase/integrase [Alicyclobacillus tolerans]|uniref:tyrosine-type recombinase/integrase n=1 Tax=Alicyclobacillus tolerans TaxID=90970 RepID=UPI003B7663ED
MEQITDGPQEQSREEPQRQKGVFKRRDLVLDRILNSESEGKGLGQEDALEYILKSCRAENYRERTLTDYRRIWSWFFEVIDTPYVNEVTPHHFRQYITTMLDERKISPRTVNIRLTALKAIFNRLHREGVLKENPVSQIRKLKTDEKSLPLMSEEQIKRLFAVIDRTTFAGNRDYVAMLVMLKEGLRNNEVMQLEIGDVDFDNNVILLPGSKNKNRKTRAVPMSSKVKTEIRTLIEETQTYFANVKYVFTNQFGVQLKDDYLRKRMHLYERKAGIAGQCQCSPHVLRHVFATRFAKLNGNLRALQQILGHGDITNHSNLHQLHEP